MRTQYITFAANEVKTFESAGGYFEILRAANDLARIDWITEDGGFSDPWELVKEGVFGYLPFKGFRITNGPTAQTIKALFGQGSGGNRAAPVSGSVGILGNVSAMSFDESRALAGATFEREVRQVMGAASVYTHLLWNPAGSGKTIIVDKTMIDTSAAASMAGNRLVKLRGYSATPAGVATPSVGAGSANGVALWADTAGGVAPWGFTGATQFDVANTTGAVSDRAYGVRPSKTIALAPGEALALWVNTSGVCNVSLAMGWKEV